MTEAEILQSKIDHGHMRDDIARLVCWNTPSRVGWMHMGSYRFVSLFDFASEMPLAHYMAPRVRR